MAAGLLSAYTLVGCVGQVPPGFERDAAVEIFYQLGARFGGCELHDVDGQPLSLAAGDYLASGGRAAPVLTMLEGAVKPRPVHEQTVGFIIGETEWSIPAQASVRLVWDARSHAIVRDGDLCVAASTSAMSEFVAADRSDVVPMLHAGAGHCLEVSAAPGEMYLLVLTSLREAWLELANRFATWMDIAQPHVRLVASWADELTEAGASPAQSLAPAIARVPGSTCLQRSLASCARHVVILGEHIDTLHLQRLAYQAAVTVPVGFQMAGLIQGVNVFDPKNFASLSDCVASKPNPPERALSQTLVETLAARITRALETP